MVTRSSCIGGPSEAGSHRTDPRMPVSSERLSHAVIAITRAVCGAARRLGSVQAPAPGRGEVAQRCRERLVIAPARRPALAAVLDHVASPRGLVGPDAEGP